MTDKLLVFVMAPSKAVAAELANSIIEKHYAACINIVDNIASIYFWENKIRSDNEALMLIKTTKSKYKILEEYILNNHPYDLPEIIASPITEGSDSYLEWLEKCAN